MTQQEAINKVITQAKKEVGYKAAPNKRNKYAAFLDKVKNFYNGPKDGFDWCDVFVDYIFAICFGVDTGRKMLYQPKMSLGAGVGYSANYFKDAGAFRQLPELGSQVFFGSQHTGIVVAITGSTITTVEGNTGGGAGEVTLKTYNRTNGSISGYGIPKWSLVATSSNVEKKEDLKIDEISKELAKKAKEVIEGKYGNGADRVKALGPWFTPVQWIVNKAIMED